MYIIFQSNKVNQDMYNIVAFPEIKLDRLINVATVIANHPFRYSDGETGAGGTHAPPDFGGSVNPISTTVGRLCPPLFYSPPRFSFLAPSLNGLHSPRSYYVVKRCNARISNGLSFRDCVSAKQ